MGGGGGPGSRGVRDGAIASVRKLRGPAINACVRALVAPPAGRGNVDGDTEPLSPLKKAPPAPKRKLG